MMNIENRVNDILQYTFNELNKAISQDKAKSKTNRHQKEKENHKKENERK